MKYKQKIIPEVLTNSATFYNQPKKKIGLFLIAYYEKNLKGKSVKNLSTGITINFTTDGQRKISKGSAAYSKKAMLLIKLIDILKYAEFSNFGLRKDSDVKNLIGFINFKAKVKIDNKIENVRIAIKMYNNGKFFYSMDVNKKPTM